MWTTRRHFILVRGCLWYLFCINRASLEAAQTSPPLMLLFCRGRKCSILWYYKMEISEAKCPNSHALLHPLLSFPPDPRNFPPFRTVTQNGPSFSLSCESAKFKDLQISTPTHSPPISSLYPFTPPYRNPFLPNLQHNCGSYSRNLRPSIILSSLLEYIPLPYLASPVP